MAKMFIAGESTGSSSGQTYSVINPATGVLVDSAPKGTESLRFVMIDKDAPNFKHGGSTIPLAPEPQFQRVLEEIRAWSCVGPERGGLAYN